MTGNARRIEDCLLVGGSRQLWSGASISSSALTWESKSVLGEKRSLTHSGLSHSQKRRRAMAGRRKKESLISAQENEKEEYSYDASLNCRWHRWLTDRGSP